MQIANPGGNAAVQIALSPCPSAPKRRGGVEPRDGTDSFQRRLRLEREDRAVVEEDVELLGRAADAVGEVLLDGERLLVLRRVIPRARSRTVMPRNIAMDPAVAARAEIVSSVCSFRKEA